MYCVVSDVFCIIHGNFKISIIDEKQKKIDSKWKKCVRKHMKEQWCNIKEIPKQHKLNMRDIGRKHASIF